MMPRILRNRALGLVLAGMLLGMVAWWFTQNFGFTSKRVHVGLSGEARVNPTFAARLLLERMGLRVHQKLDLSQAHALSEGATLVLASGRSDIDPPALDALLAWVERGGHLIVGVEAAPEHDALLSAIQVQAQWPQDAEGEQRLNCAIKDARARPADREAAARDGNTPEDVLLPDGRTLRASLGHSPVLIDPQNEPLWRHDAGDGARILVIGWGQGRITVFSTLRPFNNHNLGRFDHAELLWHVVGPPRALEVYLVRHLESATLPGWLLEHSPLALVAGAVFLVLWLWRVTPRFGPLAPSPVHDRRSLLEHIRAVGRYYAGERQHARLLRLLREDCLALFGRMAPLARGLEGAARLREASRLTRINPRELLRAFSDAAASRNEFSHMVRTLASFRRRLTRRS